MKRAIAYVDGFNLYFGIRETKKPTLKWLNIQALVQQLLARPSFVRRCGTHELVETKYFTSLISRKPAKERRQQTFLEALQTLEDFEIYYGKYSFQPQWCPNCRTHYELPTEKMSDVNLSVELMRDAFQDRFDTALIVSADSDLVPPVQAVKELFPRKIIAVALPPNRRSGHLVSVADYRLKIWERLVGKCLFPLKIPTDSGVIECPLEWRPAS